MKYDVTLGERKASIDVVRDGDGWLVRVDGGPARRVEGRRADATTWVLGVDGARRRTLGVALHGEDAFVLDGTTPRRGSVIDPRAHALDLGGAGAEGVVATQMPGAVVRVQVAVGDEVHKGQVLVVVEAMKMENEFKAPFAGRVVAVGVEAGQAIESGATLLVLEPVDA